MIHIDPVIFSFQLFVWTITLRWYGVLVMFGAVVGAWIAAKEIRRRGENGDAIWDAMIWVLPLGIIGARLWYVANNMLGGSSYYLGNPVKIFYVWEGGLHFFGGLLFGGIALYLYLTNNGMDYWLFLDSIAPAILIGQALARPANYINQELYGPPTKLLWGIPIDAQHRLAQFSDLSLYPVAVTRFHPTFAYEMILNILLGLMLLWIARQYADKMKPGAIFAGWLICAGLTRAFIEFFRPDQPRIGDSFVTYSMFVSILMAVTGVVMLLARYGKLQLAFAKGWEEEYQIKPVDKQPESPRVRAKVAVEDFAEEDRVDETVLQLEKKKPVVKAKPKAKATVVKEETVTKKSTAKPKAPGKKPVAKVKPKTKTSVKTKTVTKKSTAKPKAPKQ
jgi:phosphatidylglycerol---prolipoprotein diacylglyceryl transferase